MFCPKCSTPKTQVNTQFCTGCGLDLTQLDEFIKTGNGVTHSRFRRGLRHGVLLILLGFVLIPVWMFIGPMFPPDDRLVESAPSTTVFEQLFWILMWMSFIAGAARIVYACAFERAANVSRSQRNIELLSTEEQRSLPSADYFKPAEPYPWRSSEELFDTVLKNAPSSGELR